ncbi:GvpL/GvpF family gas vesicle protein [Streptomyces sp. NPDC032472]|uniref:GvpL/GvpF family gas vesicle protein n=1 Tax=Streptomyces sp. NPDC032472 TaxID=3155018 RepID=UPI0034025016
MNDAPATPAPTLTYVYAVSAPVPALGEVLAALKGVAGTPVTLLPPSGPVSFTVSDVPRADFDEEALKAHFEDLRWLEDTARAHHRVIEVLASHTTVLPLRMATLYQDSASALDALRAQSGAFAAQLARLSGHAEYGVKIYVRPADRPAAEPAPAAASPGKAYLAARRAQHHAHEDHYRQAQLATERIADLARRHTAGLVRHPAQSGPLAASATEENVLNDAYLVADPQADAFRAAVTGAAQDLPGIRIEVTGPWAPYSFAAP